MPSLIIPELDVLLATVLWLRERGCRPIRLSISSGSHAGRRADRIRLREQLAAAGLSTGWTTASEGPDVVAASPNEVWKVECKGAGTGVASTQRNNFDRALASTVSYYGGWTSEVAGAPPEATRYLALAIPWTPDYARELRRRVRTDLRTRLGLWILLYDPGSSAIIAVEPGTEYPT